MKIKIICEGAHGILPFEFTPTTYELNIIAVTEQLKKMIIDGTKNPHLNNMLKRMDKCERYIIQRHLHSDEAQATMSWFLDEDCKEQIYKYLT